MNLHFSFDCQMLALFSNVLPFKVHSWVEEISDTYSVVNEAVGFVGTEAVDFFDTEAVDSVDNEAVVGQVGNGTRISLEQHSSLSKLKYRYIFVYEICVL